MQAIFIALTYKNNPEINAFSLISGHGAGDGTPLHTIYSTSTPTPTTTYCMFFALSQFSHFTSQI
nr:MAG TPA: hypothetical protein [Caudoviricetes sp.]